jgi:hypothetical protein
MPQPEIPAAMRSVIAPADNAILISLKKCVLILFPPFTRSDQYLAVVLGCLQQFRFLGTSIFGEALFRLSMGITHWSGEIFPAKERPRLMIAPRRAERCLRIANGVSAAMTAGTRDDYYGNRGEDCGVE